MIAMQIGSQISCFGATGTVVSIDGERVTVKWPEIASLLPAQVHTYWRDELVFNQPRRRA